MGKTSATIALFSIMILLITAVRTIVADTTVNINSAGRNRLKDLFTHLQAVALWWVMHIFLFLRQASNGMTALTGDPMSATCHSASTPYPMMPQ
jgi:hypothetical protein